MNVDWQIYYEAAKKCHDLAADLRRADKPVHDAIKNECGGMAGDAPGCRQWGESYDRTARDTMQSCTNLADALTNFGNVLYANGYNYGIANRSKPPPARPNVRDMSVYQVSIPTSVRDNGIGIEHGGGVKELFDMLIAQIIQQFGKLPNGDVEKLAKASSVWRTFADHATVTGAAGRITEIIGLFDRIEDKNTLPLVLDHLNTLHSSATHLATATSNLAGPVAEYHTSTVNVRHHIESAVTQAEWAIGLTVVAAAAAAWFTFGGSAAAGAGGVSAIVTNTITTIRNVYQSSTLIRTLGLTAAAAGAIGTIKAFDAVPTLDSTIKSLESLILMRVLLDDDVPPKPGVGESNSPRGRVDESDKTFNDRERRIADLLAEEGKNVKAVPESTTPGQRTADATVDGTPTEFKSLDPGASNSTVKNQLNSAQGQSDHAILDARGSGLTQEEARRGLDRYLGASPGRMSNVRIVGDGWEIRWP
ncbi:hypothetical protein [Nocardia wallacei]|uniref:CdiA C-terminal domain-containing protein n=1 Tax=Nocardia wallacei TaxID=480035 RepID=UPI002457F027|nr:hypothetical protein [Nocardia wallacei]